jgi:hypothetical protein
MFTCEERATAHAWDELRKNTVASELMLPDGVTSVQLPPESVVVNSRVPVRTQPAVGVSTCSW